MALIDLLLPNEEIRYTRKIPELDVAGKYYDDLIITDKRLIFYSRTGWIFKKDESQTIGLSTITGIKFIEKGRIFKKGNIEIYGALRLLIEGNLADTRYLHQVLSERIE